MGEPLAGFGRESFEMIAGECPDIAHFGKMPLNFKRPAVQRGFAFPEQFFVTMDVATVNVVFRCVIAEQTQIEKIRRARQKFERGKISFVERSGICPNPANAIFFQQPDKLRPMPSGVSKFEREPEIPRQLVEKFAQRRFAVFWRKGGRKLDENHLELWRERLNRPKKRIQFCCAIAQSTGVRNLAWEFAGETKSSWRDFDPTLNGRFGRGSIKCRIDFHSREVIGVKFEPLGLWQVRGIKRAAPVVETPRTGSDANFMLVDQIQWLRHLIGFARLEKVLL